MIIAYLDKGIKNISTEAQKELLSTYAQNKGLKIDIFLADESILNMGKNFQTAGHIFLVANVVSLGDSLKEIAESIKGFILKKNSLVCVHGNLIFEPNKDCEKLLQGIEMAVGIRASLCSIITRKVLQKRRSNGQKLGRAFGAQSKNSILQLKGKFIMQALAQGRTKADIARELNVSWRAIYNVQKQIPTVSSITQ